MGEAKTTLEQDFKTLENLLKEMEREDIGIEDAFAKYAEGMKLIQSCNEKIDRGENAVQAIAENGELRPLDENGGTAE